MLLNEICSILLVDDEPLPRRLLSERISKIPNVILAASLPNGESALSFLKENIVDIVITDIKMPILDGLELAKLIQVLDPCCEVIIASGFNEFEYAQQAIKYGVREYLLKPLQFSQVLASIEQARKAILERRNRQLIPRYSKYQVLEKRLTDDPTSVSSKDLDKLLSVPGMVVRIAAVFDSDVQKDTLSAAIKNIMMDRLPDSVVFYLGSYGNAFNYLIIPPSQSLHHSASAVLEHLCKVFDTSLQYSFLGDVSDTRQLLNLITTYREEQATDAIQIACKYMEENMHKAITRNEVAEQVYLSSSYFGQLFKKATGIGYAEYLTNLRIERAKELLLQKISIRDIATQVGFRDVKYFSEVFRKKTGKMPRDYRNSLLAGRFNQDDAL